MKRNKHVWLKIKRKGKSDLFKLVSIYQFFKCPPINDNLCSACPDGKLRFKSNCGRCKYV